MLKFLFQKINFILDIHPNEWSRVGIAWAVGFLYRLGFIIGWTILISLILARIGIVYLPFFFILNALLLIAGSLIYAELIRHFSNDNLIIITALAGGIFLYTATFFNKFNDVFFFGIIITAQALFLGQLGILISMFNENLFTPLESERTFPLIESAETIGGIIGGVFISLLAQHIPTYKFLYLWVTVIMLIIPFLFIFWKYFKNIPFLQYQDCQPIKINRPVKNFFQNLQNIKKIPFLKGLLLIVILQWFVFNIIEFQYTRAINQKVTHSSEQTAVLETTSSLDNNRQKITNQHPEAPLLAKKAIIPKTYERELAFDLGKLNIIIYSFALLMQLFLASRIIKSIGIVNSMLIQPVLLILSTIGLTIRFNFTFAAITRTNLEISNVIFKNSYHSSYYALSHKIREEIKEFLEGIAKPFGAIIGMICILILEKILEKNENLTLSINILIFTILIILINIIFFSKNKYTKLSENSLKTSESYHSKINAIEILSQNGHQGGGRILTELLTNSAEKAIIKAKALLALGEINDFKTIPYILDCLENKNKKIRKASLKALLKFKNLGEKIFNQAFSRHRAINSLKKVFNKESSSEIRELIIKNMANFNQIDVVNFLLKTLKSAADPNIIVNCIYVCGLFHDPNTIYYLKKYLRHPHPKIQACTISALWQFPHLRTALNKLIQQMLKSQNQETIIAVIDLLGEIKKKENNKILLQHLESKNPEIQIHSAIALGKIGHKASLNYLIKFLFHNNQTIARKAIKSLSKLDPHIRRQIDFMINKNLSNQINQILSKAHKKSLIELDSKTLLKLKKVYKLAKEQDEVSKINGILIKRQSQKLAKNQALL